MHWLTIILSFPYFFLFLWIFKNLLKIKPFTSTAEPKIFVSIVVACRNEQRHLPSLLDDISVQDYNPDLFELIIIDDNSSDRTFYLASEFKGIKNIKVIRNNGKGKKQAIRTGVNYSSGDIIITTDADCRVGNNWIRTVASFSEENQPDMIIGRVILTGNAGFFNKFQELEFLGIQGVTAGTAAGGDPVICNGANLAFTKVTFNNHADNLHYELASGDDVFLLQSLKKEPGNKIMWLESGNSGVSTQACENPRSFLNQRARWLSKAGAYRDRFTVMVAIVTFVTILLLVSLLVTGLLIPENLMVFLAVFLVKSIPDFLILLNTAKRYDKKKLIKWFLPSQLVYPFYVISVVLWSAFSSERSTFNFPSQKGT